MMIFDTFKHDTSMKKIKEMTAEECLEKANKSLNMCLQAKENFELVLAISELRKALFALDQFNDEVLKIKLRANSKLFIKIFQFNLLIRDKIWSLIPNVYLAIGDIIDQHRGFENEFRERVISGELGILLDFIND